jgi:hypothetical protein
MYLSYSGYKKLECMFAYWNEYINKTPKTGPDDRLGSIYGSVVGKLFEYFYTDKVWKKSEPQAYLMSRVEETVDKTIRRETTDWRDRKGGVLLWKGDGEGQNPKGMYANREELIRDVRDAVARGFRIIRHHRLLGPRTDAEYKLDYTYEGDTYGGRADFIIQRTKPFNDLLIVDGKGSQHRGRYVDPQQLKWYAMLYWLHSAVQGKPQLPDKLAFLYWRSPPDECMDWISISESDVMELFEVVKAAVDEIKRLEKMLLPNAPIEGARGVFKPKANEKNCRFCPYASVCPPGAKVQETLKEKQRR